MFTSPTGHRCGLGVTSLLITQRARVRSPFGSVSWWRFFLGFSQNVRKFGPHLSPVTIWQNHISSVNGRRQSLTLAIVHGRRLTTNNNSNNLSNLSPLIGARIMCRIHSNFSKMVCELPGLWMIYNITYSRNFEPRIYNSLIRANPELNNLNTDKFKRKIASLIECLYMTFSG